MFIFHSIITFISCNIILIIYASGIEIKDALVHPIVILVYLFSKIVLYFADMEHSKPLAVLEKISWWQHRCPTGITFWSVKISKLVVIIFMGYFLLVTMPPFIHYTYTHTTSVYREVVSKHTCEQTRIQQPFSKVVHQTWKSKTLPKEWQRYRNNCQKMNPDFEFHIWTDKEVEAFLQDNYPWFVPTYKTYPYKIQKFDSVRYFILNHYGGIYMDLDINCKIPFQDIFNNISYDIDVILAATNPIGVTNNFMVSKPNQPFMKMLTHDLVDANHMYVTPHWTVMMSAGPLFVFRSLEKYPCQSHVHVLTVEQHQQYFFHIQAATWHSWDGPMMVFVDNYHRCVIAFFVIVLIVLALHILRQCLLCIKRLWW